MMEYKVLSDIIGKRNKIFKVGETITESDVSVGAIKSLINRGFITPKLWKHPENGEKIRVAIVTSIWKRPEVLRMYIDGLLNLAKNCSDFDFRFIISGSAQDEFLNNEDIVNEIQFRLPENGRYKYIEIPNEPLAAKVNATTYACKNLDVHYVICLGSDDIMSPELLNEYAEYMRKGIDFIGVTDCYFYDTVSNQSLYWGGYREEYRKGHTAGAFRALSARLLSQWDWMPWENKDSAVLDKSMQDKLKITPHTIETFSMKERGVYGIDIKSSTNMTPFRKWDNSEFISNDFVEKHFPYILNK